MLNKVIQLMQDSETATVDDVTKHMEMIEEVRRRAKIVSCKADTKMIEMAKSKNPPTKYQCGDSVIVRRFSSSTKRVSAKNKQRRFVTGEVIKESSKSGNYKVKYVLDGEEHVDLVSVKDLTSTTLQEEKERREHHHSSTIIQWYLSYFLFISL